MTKTESGMQADKTRIKAANHIRAITAHAIRMLTTNPRGLLSEVKKYIAYQLNARVAAGLVDDVTPESVEAIVSGAFQSLRTKAAMLAALEAVHATTDKAVSEYYDRRRKESHAKKAAETAIAVSQAIPAAMSETEIRAAVYGYDVPKGVHVSLKNDAYGATQITIRTDNGQMWRKWNYETDFRFELYRELAYYAIPKVTTLTLALAETGPAVTTELTIADNVNAEIAEKVRTISRRWILKPGYRLEVTEDALCVEALIWRGEDIYYSGWSVDDDFIYDLDQAMQKAAKTGAPV